MMTGATLRYACPVSALLLWLMTPRPTRAEDLVTLSGVTYHEVRMVRVEPDGVTWEHATGMCKVDFTDSPEAVRKAYHYDAKKAAEYQAAQAQARQQAAAQTQQILQGAAARQTARSQAPAAFAGADAPSGSFVYRQQPAGGKAGQAIGEQIEAEKAAHNLLTKDDGSLWDRRLWALPRLLTGADYLPDLAFEPGANLNAQEYQASLHNVPGASAADGVNGDFFKPDYQTKAYYEDLDRAKAFASGQPLSR